jgi:hypothetical protein
VCVCVCVCVWRFDWFVLSTFSHVIGAGHIDNMARFLAPGVIALHWTDDESDPQHAVSLDALQRIEAATDAKGRRIKVCCEALVTVCELGSALQYPAGRQAACAFQAAAPDCGRL